MLSASAFSQPERTLSDISRRNGVFVALYVGESYKLAHNSVDWLNKHMRPIAIHYSRASSFTQ
jgi:hypothetical protein